MFVLSKIIIISRSRHAIKQLKRSVSCSRRIKAHPSQYLGRLKMLLSSSEALKEQDGSLITSADLVAEASNSQSSCTFSLVSTTSHCTYRQVLLVSKLCHLRIHPGSVIDDLRQLNKCCDIGPTSYISGF